MGQCLNIFTVSICRKVFGCQVVAITEKLSCGQSNIPPSQERTASKKANSARKAIRLTTMLATKPTAEVAPWDTASNTFVHSLRRHRQHFDVLNNQSSEQHLRKIVLCHLHTGIDELMTF